MKASVFLSTYKVTASLVHLTDYDHEAAGRRRAWTLLLRYRDVIGGGDRVIDVPWDSGIVGGQSVLDAQLRADAEVAEILATVARTAQEGLWSFDEWLSEFNEPSRTAGEHYASWVAAVALRHKFDEFLRRQPMSDDFYSIKEEDE